MQQQEAWMRQEHAVDPKVSQAELWNADPVSYTVPVPDKSTTKSIQPAQLEIGADGSPRTHHTLGGHIEEAYERKRVMYTERVEECQDNG